MNIKHIPEGNFRTLAFGRAFKENHIEMIPTGDKVINAVRGALWDAWALGLDESGKTIFPRLPLLDREPMEPEM